MYTEILKNAIAKYGTVAQMGVATEECAELIKAISKCCRYGCEGERRENLIEEMADVTIILDELMLIYDIDLSDVFKVIEQKMKRLEMGLKE